MFQQSSLNSGPRFVMTNAFCRLVVAAVALAPGCAVSPVRQIARLDGAVEQDSDGTVVGIDLSRGVYAPVLGQVGGWQLIGDPLLRSGRVDDSNLSELRGFSELRSLSLTGTNVTGSGLASIPNRNSLLKLDLSATEIANCDLHIVGAFRNLTELHLSGTPISDDGLRHLTKLDKLEILAVDDTQVSDNGLVILLALPSLRTIYARDSRVSPEIVKQANETNPRVSIHIDKTGGGVI